MNYQKCVKMTSGFLRLYFYFLLKSDWIQFKQGMQKNPSNPIDLQNPRSDGQIGDVAVAFHEVSFLRKKLSTVFLLIHTDYRLIELINTNKDMKNWKNLNWGSLFEICLQKLIFSEKATNISQNLQKNIWCY